MEIKGLHEIDFNQPDLVLLDLDNSLYIYKPTHAKALAAMINSMHGHTGIDKNMLQESYNEHRKKINTRHKGQAVSHSRLFYIQGMVEALCGYTDVKLIRNMYNVYWDVFIESIEMCGDVIDFFENCAARKIPVVLVSDMTAEIQFRKIEKMGINRYLDFIVTSEEAGCEKPNPVIFELAIGKIKERNIQRIAVIGDDIHKDCFTSSGYQIINYHLLRDE